MAQRKKILQKSIPQRRSMRIANKSKKKQQPKIQKVVLQKMEYIQALTNGQQCEQFIQIKKKRIHPAISRSLAIRPQKLSQGIFYTLFNNLVRVHCFVQLIQSRKKRQNCYSIRVSDGYFRVKLIAMGQAGRQLNKDEIKQFFILEADIEHQGEGICLMTKIYNTYQFTSSVGFTEQWRFNRVNKNQIGTALIPWEKISKSKIEQPQTDQTLMNSINFTTNMNGSVVSKRKPPSICRTQSISIAFSKFEVENKDNFLKNNKEAQFTQKQLQKMQKKKLTQTLSINKSAQKDHKLQKKSITFSNKYQSPLRSAKKQVTIKKLLLSDRNSDQQYNQKIQQKYNKKQQNQLSQYKQQNIVKAQHQQLGSSRKLNNQQLEQSWQAFLDDFIVFQKARQVENLRLSTKIQPKQKTQQKEKISKSKIQILDQLFGSNDSDDEKHGCTQSNNGNQIHMTNQFIKQTQTFSPRLSKHKNHLQQIWSLFDQQQSVKKQQQKNQSKLKQKSPQIRYQHKQMHYQNEQVKYQQKQIKLQSTQQHKSRNYILDDLMAQIQLQWQNHINQNQSQKIHVNQSQNNLSQNQLNDIFGSSSKKNMSNSKLNNLLDNTSNKMLNIKTNNVQNNKSHQISTELSKQEQQLKDQQLFELQNVFTLKDLLEDHDFFVFCANKNLRSDTQWFLRVKFLAFQNMQSKSQQTGNSNSNFLNLRSKGPKQVLCKCLVSMDDNSIIASLMIPKRVILSLNISSNQCYLLKSPQIIQYNNIQTQHSSYPANMYVHWIDASLIKNDSFVRVKSRSITNRISDQWIDTIQSIQAKQDSDVVNVVGFVTVYRQNTIADKNSQTNNLSKFRNNNFPKKEIRVMTNIQLLDPFTGHITSMTDFTNSDLKIQKYSIILIIRGRVNLYKNKKCLMSKPQTLILTSVPKSPKCLKLLKFLQSHPNIKQSLDRIDIQLTGYSPCLSILQVIYLKDNTKGKVKTEVFNVKKISYIACAKCAKKVVQGNICTKCGLLRKDQILQRAFYNGTLGDETASIAMTFEHQVFQRLSMRLAEKNIKKQSKSKNQTNNPWDQEDPSAASVMSLKRFQIWFSFQNKDKPIIVDKLMPISQKDSIESLLAYFKN